VNNSISPISLLPWLKRENNVFLDIYSHPVKNNLLTSGQGVCRVLSDINPFFRILKVDLSTVSGFSLKELFLIQQKDDYSYTKNILETISNSVIDGFWQDNISCSRSQGTCVELISSSPDACAPAPFRALFYCQFKQLYFHPICPECGALLDQYYQDEPLAEAGVHPYSSTLRRYLYCSACDSDSYYVYQREDDDAPFVFDRFVLIRDFGRQAKASTASSLPCCTCNCKEECYGEQGLSVSRISPFSFYNSYMVAFSASSLTSFDFIALVSGASPAELQAAGNDGRFLDVAFSEQIKNNFLFSGRDKWFLEILFLKLTYLSQLAHFALSEEVLKNYSDLEISLDQFWIDFPIVNNHLPNFWNFTVKPLGGGVLVTNRNESFLPATRRLHSYILIWFATLLANSRQSIADIRLFLISMTSRLDEEELPESSSNPLLAAENIFWKPQEYRSESGLFFWTRALQLGWDLFRTSQNQQRGCQPGIFTEALQKLTAEVKDALFTEATAEVATSKEVGDLRSLGTIIGEIKERWQRVDAESVSEPYEEPHPELEGPPIAPTKTVEELDKTVILHVAEPEVDLTNDAKNEDIDKTVIIAVEQNPENAEVEMQPPVTPEPSNDDHLDETIILNPAEFEQKMKPRRHD